MKKQTIKSDDEIEDLLYYRLVWDPKTKMYKKMIVYRKEDLKESSKK
tara:strand:+ start:318 stop:458 length:141 start_codon:yes stop_codon:yes gene_type:complete